MYNIFKNIFEIFYNPCHYIIVSFNKIYWLELLSYDLQVHIKFIKLILKFAKILPLFHRLLLNSKIQQKNQINSKGCLILFWCVWTQRGYPDVYRKFKTTGRRTDRQTNLLTKWLSGKNKNIINISWNKFSMVESSSGGGG